MVVATIIGGAGRMGIWFATFLKQNGYQVTIFDQNRKAAHRVARSKGFRFLSDLSIATRSARLIFLATPTRDTKRILAQVINELSRESLLVEISSIKEPLNSTMQELRKRGLPLLSFHPMWGPGTKTVKGRTVLATSIPPRNLQAGRLLSLLRKKGARIVRCTVKEHDELMSALLSLPHMLNTVMVSTLKARGFNPNRLRTLSGTTFDLQILIAEAIHRENLENEASILMDSLASVRILGEYARQCRNANKLIKNGTRERLIKNLKSNRAYLKRDTQFARAYDKFNAAVERVR